MKQRNEAWKDVRCHRDDNDTVVTWRRESTDGWGLFASLSFEKIGNNKKRNEFVYLCSESCITIHLAANCAASSSPSSSSSSSSSSSPLCGLCWNRRREEQTMSPTKAKLSRRPSGTPVVWSVPSPSRVTVSGCRAGKTRRRQKPQLQLPFPIFHHIFPPRRQVWTKDREKCQRSVSHLAQRRRNKTTFAHYANRIDSISDAFFLFFRVITPKVSKKKGRRWASYSKVSRSLMCWDGLSCHTFIHGK